jgi:hypothetical protein
MFKTTTVGDRLERMKLNGIDHSIFCGRSTIKAFDRKTERALSSSAYPE